MPLILAIDQGTTSTKCLLVDASSGHIEGRGAAPVGISFPAPGWVEQDADDIWTSVEQAAAACFRDADKSPSDVAGVAISNQRESVVAWDAKTGDALSPVLGWQDSRTAKWCEGLDEHREIVRAKTGLPLDAMFSAPKMRWLLDHLDYREFRHIRIGTIDAC